LKSFVQSCHLFAHAWQRLSLTSPESRLSNAIAELHSSELFSRKFVAVQLWIFAKQSAAGRRRHASEARHGAHRRSRTAGSKTVRRRVSERSRPSARQAIFFGDWTLTLGQRKSAMSILPSAGPPTNL